MKNSIPFPQTYTHREAADWQNQECMTERYRDFLLMPSGGFHTVL